VTSASCLTYLFGRIVIGKNAFFYYSRSSYKEWILPEQCHRGLGQLGNRQSAGPVSAALSCKQKSTFETRLGLVWLLIGLSLVWFWLQWNGQLGNRQSAGPVSAALSCKQKSTFYIRLGLVWLLIGLSIVWIQFKIKRPARQEAFSSPSISCIVMQTKSTF
jgi:hypothetical protein